jgi:hypothetical protein
MNFYPEEYDAGASPTKHEWKTTQCTSMHFEVMILNLRWHIMQISEKIEIKEHLKCLGAEPLHEIVGECIFFNVVDCSTRFEAFSLICLSQTFIVINP